jgi:ABC-type uncharacterized transport system permease subunit
MSLVPVQAVRDGSWLEAIAVVVAAVVYSVIAAAIFNRGLRRYSSGNRILELR